MWGLPCCSHGRSTCCCCCILEHCDLMASLARLLYWVAVGEDSSTDSDHDFCCASPRRSELVDHARGSLIYVDDEKGRVRIKREAFWRTVNQLTSGSIPSVVVCWNKVAFYFRLGAGLYGESIFASCGSWVLNCWFHLALYRFDARSTPSSVATALNKVQHYWLNSGSTALWAT